MGWGEGEQEGASSRSSEWCWVRAAALCFWLSLLLYNVSWKISNGNNCIPWVNIFRELEAEQWPWDNCPWIWGLCGPPIGLQCGESGGILMGRSNGSHSSSSNLLMQISPWIQFKVRPSNEPSSPQKGPREKWHEKSFDTCFYNWTWSCYHNLILVTCMAGL